MVFIYKYSQYYQGFKLLHLIIYVIIYNYFYKKSKFTYGIFTNGYIFAELQFQNKKTIKLYESH